MEQQPIEKTVEEGVPQCVGPKTTEVQKDQVEEKTWPKLSPADFKKYNRMAEHMDYFVSTSNTSAYEESQN